MPNYEEHSQFVINNPYRYWYFIVSNNAIVGTVYVTYENNIGINISKRNHNKIIPEVIKKIQEKTTPLPAVKSVRGDGFYLNVSSGNFGTIRMLKQKGYMLIQHTFKISSV